jgi:hypothetical protein
MAGKQPIYAHGELDAVKKRLGPLSEDETRKMREVLGGEIGRERSEYEENKSKPAKTPSKGAAPKKPSRIVEIAAEDEKPASKKTPKAKYISAGDVSPQERAKMDAICAETEYSIKTWLQALRTRLPFAKNVPDKVSPYFVKKILTDYYNNLESFVTQTRIFFPRNNREIAEQLKSASQFSFTVLDVIRRWNIETINAERIKYQRRHKNVVVTDLSLLVFEIYKPIYKLRVLDVNPHIETAYNVLYKILQQNPNPNSSINEKQFAKTIAAFHIVCKDMAYRMYPLLLKLSSSEFYYYEEFFTECKENIENFLGLTAKDVILPPKNILEADFLKETPGAEKEEIQKQENAATEGAVSSENEQKAVDKGLSILDALFPQAGWLEIASFPDMYPYFSDVKTFQKGAAVIAPEDPALLVLILTSIIEDLMYGFRKIQFIGEDGDPDLRSIKTFDNLTIGTILNNWQKVVEESFERYYLPRLQEYVQLHQQAGAQKTNAPYAVKLRTALQWTRKLFFFPYYEYKDNTPPPFKKSDITPLFPLVRQFRKKLTMLANQIGKAQKEGQKEGSLESIKNPWDPYVFQIENPLSKRINMMLGKNQRNNVSLIFFTLAITTVLDDMMNNPQSFVYSGGGELPKLFRTGEDGVTPVLWVGKTTNTFSFFQAALPSGGAQK